MYAETSTFNFSKYIKNFRATKKHTQKALNYIKYI